MVTAEGREQLRRVDDNAGMLVLLKLEHPAIETIYAVSDTRNWEIDGITYIGLPFKFKPPQATSGEAPRATIEVDNVGGELTQELEKLPPAGALTATITVVSRRTPTVVEVTLQAPLSGVSCTPAVMTAVIGNDDAMRASAVRVRYDPKNSPGLFAG